MRRLLIDDNQGNIKSNKGSSSILFQNREAFERELTKVFPFIENHK
jgi:hypothetical protein